MCATYWLGESIEHEITNLLNELNGHDAVSNETQNPPVPGIILKTGDIYPKGQSGVIVSDSDSPGSPGSLVLACANWGFPRGNTDVVYNSRADKVTESRFWRDSYLNNRGFVVCSGFYENKKNEEGKNVRYLFTFASSKPIYIASIQQKQKNTIGETILYYSLLTTEANSSVSPVHHRMPLILEKEDLCRWIADTDFADSVLTSEMPLLSCSLNNR